MKWLSGLRRTERQISGDAAEDAALAYLERAGLRSIERNFRCKGGEIDLILRDGDMLVFVEVRKRADGRHGGAAASVTAAKQRRIVIAAQTYLQRFPQPPACRIDVIAFEGVELHWLKDAVAA